MGDKLNVGNYLVSIASKSIYKVQCRDSNSWYCYSSVSAFYCLCLMFRYHYNTRTSLLCDILACDYLEYKLRFFISYNVYSLIYNIRILLSMVLSSSEKIVSLTKIFPCSNWFEREIFDMYGIKFTAHMDMRRILTDYGFQWHPLRKDFPLTGYIETHYSEKFKCVMHNNVNLIQDSHIWIFEQQWSYHDTEKTPNEEPQR